MDKHICIGNMGKDPEEKDGKNNKSFYVSSLGVSVYNGEENETVWYNLTFNDSFKKRLDLCKKGTKLYVEGSLKIKTYTNKDDDVMIDRTINVTFMDIVGGMKDKEEREESGKSLSKEKTKGKAKKVEAEEEEDDLPF